MYIHECAQVLNDGDFSDAEIDSTKLAQLNTTRVGPEVCNLYAAHMTATRLTPARNQLAGRVRDECELVCVLVLLL